MALEMVIYEDAAPGVKRLTLNRPDRMNAYNHQLCAEMMECIGEFQTHDDDHVLIITGAGRGFCSGGDVAGGSAADQSFGTRQLGHGRQMLEGSQRVVLALTRLDKPVIAMVNGPAVAGGLAIALACDFRIAGSAARLGDTSGKFGLLPDEGGAWLFPHVMGYDRALKMTLFHEIYDADEALRLGLVTEVVDQDRLEERTLEFAGELAKKAPLAVRLSKQMMRRASDLSLEQSQNEAALAVEISNPAADVREGRAAFFEKREPKFKGS